MNATKRDELLSKLSPVAIEQLAEVVYALVKALPVEEERTCVCGHPETAHEGPRCTVAMCACGPGCIHEGFVDAASGGFGEPRPQPDSAAMAREERLLHESYSLAHDYRSWDVTMANKATDLARLLSIGAKGEQIIGDYFRAHWPKPPPAAVERDSDWWRKVSAETCRAATGAAGEYIPHAERLEAVEVALRSTFDAPVAFDVEVFIEAVSDRRGIHAGVWVDAMRAVAREMGGGRGTRSESEDGMTVYGGDGDPETPADSG